MGVDAYAQPQNGTAEATLGHGVLSPLKSSTFVRAARFLTWCALI